MRSRFGVLRAARSLRASWSLCAAWSLLLVAGCGESLTGGVVPDSAPETEVTATPPVLAETEYTVSFFWTGYDPDGEISGYEWRISDNGEDGIVDIADTLTSALPWAFTTTTDSTFVVTADIKDFQKDIDDSLSEKSTRYWQTHTFFVRSVDANGNVDPTPANVSFTATTLAPTVQIILPATGQINSCSQAPPAIAFGWEAADPDNQEKVPKEVRYILKKYKGASDACLTDGMYNAGDFQFSNDDPAWSPWIRYDAGLDSGKVVRYPARPVSDLGTSYMFAVQARDVAGAVTPLFEWGKNVRHVRLTDSKAPALSVTERFLGTELFTKTNKTRAFTIASKQQIEFSWFADASTYGNLIEGYRYGFNLLDPDDADDPGWVVPWGTGPNWRRAAARTFAQGSPNFVVQARDNSNQLSRGTYRFEVVQVARRAEQRNLLLVDDHPKSAGVATAEQIDAEWDLKWKSLIELIGVQGFQSADVVDAVDQPQRLSFPLINQYRGVVWFIGPGQSYFKLQMAPQNRTTPRFNWLEVYQSFVGNVLFVGSAAIQSTLEEHSQLQYPIVFNTSSGAGSLGVAPGPTGESINAGTQRYPYTGWCLESLDNIRPAKIFGEQPGQQIRAAKCGSIVYAGPTEEFLERYGAKGIVPPLRPTDIREFGPIKYFTGGLNPTELNTASLGTEEFYNVNVTSMPVTINPRNCQTPMYRAIARRDVDEPVIFDNPLADGWMELGLDVMPAIVDSIFNPNIDPVNWVDNCVSQTSRARRSTSVVSLKTIGVASRVFSGGDGVPGTKQDGTLTASDFLWGFNPIQFRPAGVQKALQWMIIQHWAVNDEF